jgi:hypothetical protein
MNQQAIIDELRERIAKLEAVRPETVKPRRRNYNQQQAAERLNMSVNKFRSLCKEGRGPRGVLDGRIWRFTDEALTEYELRDG